MERRTVKIGLVQQAVSGNNRQENWLLSAEQVAVLAEQGAELVLLQELHSTLYFCQEENAANFDFAETIPGEATVFFEALARRLNIVLVVSLFEKRAPGLHHNTAVVFDRDRGMVGKYRKMHIPDDPGYYEKFYFSPGDTGFTPIATSIGKLGVLICWDQWYPEAARLMAMAGADILLYPTAIGWDDQDDSEEKQRQHSSWEIIQRSHAVANGLPVMVANRTGFEVSPMSGAAGIRFWGQSFIAGAQGEILARAGIDSEENLLVTLDLGRSEQVRRNWPFFRDRRIDAYREISRCWLD